MNLEVKTAPFLIGKSKELHSVLRILSKIVNTDSTVLIQGESGTGKELVARYIHASSARSARALISVNCSAFNDSLLESELFGYRRGAFTGARENRSGIFQLADRGTLFLDEVSEMSPQMQKKLLRILESGEVRPLGSDRTHRSDVRILAATNKDLKELVEAGDFRSDLYFRLNVITVNLPSLRQRREDIPLLVQHYCKQICDELNRSPIKLPTGMLKLFQEYEWPGNVRELINELRKVILLESQYEFDGSLAKQKQESEEQKTFNLRNAEKGIIDEAMSVVKGNKAKAARLLGISRRALYDKLKGK